MDADPAAYQAELARPVRETDSKAGVSCCPVCMQVYGIIGIFGAARYGAGTEGNVLVNEWLGGPAEGVLDLAIAAYLSISVPPMQVPQHSNVPFMLPMFHSHV